jgi:DNA-directed RNA polymerase specialized sigma24 family protein
VLICPPMQSNTRSFTTVHTTLIGVSMTLAALVARYYPAVYNFASRLTDDPRQAVLLTQRAFTSILNQLWIPRDEIALVRILLKAVVRAGLIAT